MTTSTHLAMDALYAAWLAAPHKTATLRAVTEHFRNQLPSDTFLGKPCRKHGHTWNDTPWCLRKGNHCVECTKARHHIQALDPKIMARKREENRRYRSRKASDPSYRRYHIEKARRRKAWERGNHVVRVTTSQIHQRFMQFGHCCAYCGASDQQLHVEHFLPISKGGTHVLSNILPACPACNYSKLTHDPEAWYRAQPFFTKQRWRMILRVLGKQRVPVGQLSLV